MLYSVYLHDGEGLDERNQRILHLIGERIRAHQLPLIVAGDFNFPVSVLQESGWMRRLQLRVLQPEIEVPTFVPKNRSSNDFVLVSRVLLSRCMETFVELDSGQSAWDTSVELDSGFHEHRPVCFSVVHRGPEPKDQGVG